MKIKFRLLILLSLTTIHALAEDSIFRVDKNIQLTKLEDNIYLINSSYSSNGNLDCNHLLVIDNKDIVLVNTPASDSLTRIMLHCIEKKFNRKVTKVIVSHFHDDSSGGLQSTKNYGITSYGLAKTNDLLKPKNLKIDEVFTDSLIISLQTIEINLYYFGAGHSVDNIVTWLPKQRILFGGCLLKSMDAKDKGNIKDADLQAWPITVQRVKAKCGNAKIVIPGHSSIGNASIFDHTIQIISMK